MMKDVHIRAALKKALAGRYRDDPESLVIEEIGLRDGTARIDVAVVNHALHGFEIKSDHDRVDRLPHQSETYGAVFDRLTLVVGPKLHKTALEIIPEWWGVELAETVGKRKIQFSSLRVAQENRNFDALAIAKLLWREEALNLLIELGQSKGVLSKPRARIHERLAEVSDLEFLRYRVRDRLKNRANWRFDEPQNRPASQ
jgi:hypothetical protein